VICAPEFVPSTRNWTKETGLSGSLALAVTLTTPASVAPAAGDVIETTGGVVSPPEEAVVNVRSPLTTALLLASDECTR